jgi:hypothetical protein
VLGKPITTINVSSDLAGTIFGNNTQKSGNPLFDAIGTLMDAVKDSEATCR